MVCDRKNDEKPPLEDLKKVVDFQCQSDGFTVMAWPELAPLLDRFGVPFELGTTKLVLTIGDGEAVTIQHTYLGQDRTKSDKSRKPMTWTEAIPYYAAKNKKGGE